MGASLAALQAIEQLWESVGGSAALAPDMAAIADAESGLSPTAAGGPNTDGTYDYGLFQINGSNLSGLGLTTSSALNAVTNAKAAVMLDNNSTSGLSNWATWTSFQKLLAGESSTLTAPQLQAAQTVQTDLATLNASPASTATTTPATTSDSTPSFGFGTPLENWLGNALQPWFSSGGWIVLAVGIGLILLAVLIAGIRESDQITVAPSASE